MLYLLLYIAGVTGAFLRYTIGLELIVTVSREVSTTKVGWQKEDVQSFVTSDVARENGCWIAPSRCQMSTGLGLTSVQQQSLQLSNAP